MRVTLTLTLTSNTSKSYSLREAFEESRTLITLESRNRLSRVTIFGLSADRPKILYLAEGQVLCLGRRPRHTRHVRL